MGDREAPDSDQDDQNDFAEVENGHLTDPNSPAGGSSSGNKFDNTSISLLFT